MTAMPPSLWAATAPPGPPCPRLEGSEETEVIVIGAGYTGLSAALHLAESGRAVRVLDSAEPGWGCSGRNGGQVNPGGARILPEELIALFGRERDQRAIALCHETCDLVFDLIDRHAIDCDAVRPGYVQGGYGRFGRRQQEDWARQWGEHGVEVQLLDRNGVADLIGSQHYDNAMLDPRGGNVQPLSYVRGLARAAVDAGAVIHGASHANAVKRDGPAWQVSTPEGAVTAPHVLLCTNGYTDDLWPGLRQSVVAVCTFVAATKPLGHNVLSTVLPGQHAVSESTRIIVYYRLDRDGRFMIGGHGNFLNLDEQGDDAHVRNRAIQLFPQLADVEWEYHWAGYPAMTLDHFPKLMQLGAGAYAGLGYNGRGVAMATMMGKQLAMVVNGEDPALPVEPMKRIPLHGFRQLGVSYRLLSGTLLDRVQHG